jgi:hypothetical protein
MNLVNRCTNWGGMDIAYLLMITNALILQKNLMELKMDYMIGCVQVKSDRGVLPC